MPSTPPADAHVFKDRCPACKTGLMIDLEVAGPLTRCPKCGAVLRVVPPASARKRQRRVDDSLGPVAVWICAMGALLMLGGVVALMVTAADKRAARTRSLGSVPVTVRPSGGSDGSWLTPPPAAGWEPEDEELTEGRPGPVASPRGTAELPASPAPSPPRATPALESASPADPTLRAQLVALWGDVFAHREDGRAGPILWRPAPFDHHFVFFRLRLGNPQSMEVRLFFDRRASERAISLNHRSGAAAACLGRQTSSRAAPLQFDPRPFTLAPGTESLELTVAFIVPSSWRAAALVGPGFDLGALDLPRPPEPTLKSLHPLAGRWMRAPGQPLKLYFSDPVLSELSRPRLRQLFITSRGPEECVLALPHADIGGSLKLSSTDARRSILNFSLTLGSSSLHGRARLADDDILVFYASDQPFEQIIYVRKPM